MAEEPIEICCITEDGKWEYGHNRFGVLRWLRLLETPWFLQDVPYFLYVRHRVSSDELAKSLELFQEGEWVSTYYWFYAVTSVSDAADDIIKWMVGPLKELMVERKLERTYQLPFNALDFGELVEAVSKRAITPTMGKDVLLRMFNGERVSDVLQDDKYKASSGDELDGFIKIAIDSNKEQFEKLKGGEIKLLNWFVGQVMKAARGKADAAQVRTKIEELLSG